MLQFKKIAQENVQICPFCSMPQEGIVNGIEMKYHEDGPATVDIKEDRWYSFCNCKNIFFTDKKNLQDVYDFSYQNRYKDNDGYEPAIKEAEAIIDSFPVKSGLFAEAGVAFDYVLDAAKRKGFETIAVDINPDLRTKHLKFIGSIEDDELLNKLPKMDVLWASHLVEHFKQPLETCRKIYNKLNDNGVFYVAMPDPYCIPWENPYQWAHWHVKEHYILWDMDSFIDEMLKIGFKLLRYKRRTLKTDYEIVFQK